MNNAKQTIQKNGRQDRIRFGKVGYINVSELNTGSVSKSVYGDKNPKDLIEALTKANETLDKMYEKYIK